MKIMKMIKLFILPFLLLFAVVGSTSSQVNLNDLSDNITAIIQNDTTLNYHAVSYEYEVENDAILYPDSIVAHLNYELFNNIPEQYEPQLVNFVKYDLCHLNIQVPGHGSVPKYSATYTFDGEDYPICFYVLDLGNNIVSINYRFRLQLFWF